MIRYFNALMMVALCGCSLHHSPLPEFSTVLEEFSFYDGYAIQEQAQFFGIPRDLDQFIAGMRAAQKGDPLDGANTPLFTRVKEERFLQQSQDNLAAAENFLRGLIDNPDVIEKVPEKLYTQVLKPGKGPEIPISDLMSMSYAASTLIMGKEEVVSSSNGVIALSVLDTIPGFAQGVQGMRSGETRKIFIHPDLAYGSCGGALEPNQILIIEVTAQ